MQTGVAFALRDRSARYFVTFDADGQHRVADAAAMVDRLRDGSVDVLIGSRFLGSATNMRRGRKALLRAARVFEHASSGIALTDAHNGLRAFTRKFAEMIDLRVADMGWASEFLAKLGESRLPYAEHPVTIEYSDYSLSKGQHSINSVNIGVDVLVNRLLKRSPLMAWIKVLLITSSLLLLVILFRHRQRVALRAGSRIAAIGLFIAAVASIADPDIPQAAAERLGVARGTDLLLYLLVVVFALSTMGLYFRLRETDHRVRQLARALAIEETMRREMQQLPAATDGAASPEPVVRGGSEQGRRGPSGFLTPGWLVTWIGLPPPPARRRRQPTCQTGAAAERSVTTTNSL